MDTEKELLEQANELLKQKKYQAAQKKFKQAIEVNSINWKAHLYMLYCKAMLATISQIESVSKLYVDEVQILTDSICKSGGLSDVEQKKAVQETVSVTLKISDRFYSMACEQYNPSPEMHDNDFVMRWQEIRMVPCSFAEKIHNLYKKEHPCFSMVNKLYKKVVEIDADFHNKQYRKFYNSYLNFPYFDLSNPEHRNHRDLVMNTCTNAVRLLNFTVEQIRITEPDYTPPEIKTADFFKNKGVVSTIPTGGCYVATAVYGSYDCPQVWTLRRYRDYTLAKTWYGRAFIHTYYAISPTLVKWFGHTEWFKNMWQGKLDKMVSKLQAEGVEATPYEDRRW